MMENIAKAFVKAQKEFGTAHKTSNNPFFKSKYADLSVVIAAVLDSLNNNGIALIQNCHESDTGVIVETIFLHESGESISCGRLSVPAAKNDPQGYGSALTYGRRYSLMAACGIAPEDDDGNLATVAVQTKQTTPRLPTLTDSQAEIEYLKWTDVKSLLLDADGTPDQDKIVEEWHKLPSNIRTAIKKHGENIKMVNEMNSNGNSHLNEIAKES
jgi:hypothetical protein